MIKALAGLDARHALASGRMPRSESLKYIRPECRFQPLTGSQVHQRSGAKLTAATGRAIPPCENVRRWHVGGTLSRELAATVELDPRRNLDQLDQGGSHSTR